jgi:hypothetical protein
MPVNNLKNDKQSIKLEQVDSDLINPATEDKQDDIIANQTNGNQITQIFDSAGNEVDFSTLQSLVGFEIPPYDDIVLSYTDNDLTGVVYKKGGSAVKTLSLSYTDGNLTRIWEV